MPELPEVQTVVSDLQEILPGKKIAAVEIVWPRTVATPEPQIFGKVLAGRKIKAVSRRAKFIVITFDNNGLLLFHLRMSGQLFWRRKDSQEDRHARIKIHFSDRSVLVFNDARKFGRAYFFENQAEAEKQHLWKLGPEPLEISAEEFVEIFRKRKGRIKANLLRQDLICGLGNIYVDESLWQAKIHPQSQTAKILVKKLRELHRAIREILQAAIALRGTSMRSYLDTTGNAGRYKEILKVYQQHGEKCPRCGSKIQKLRVAGRGTHVCVKCQKKY